MADSNGLDVYDAVASEYYEDRHITSRNFDEATNVAMQDLKASMHKTGLILDVGCGKGRASEYLGVDTSRVVQLDNSSVMLELQPRETALLRICHEAEVLPFLDGQFSCAVGFLCDAYLGLSFLAEAHRILEIGGFLIITTPSYEWAQALRAGLHLNSSTTRFLLKSGDRVVVPSNIFPAEQLRGMMKHVGFREESIDFRRLRLAADTRVISPDISTAAEKGNYQTPFDLDILYCISAKK